MAPLIPKYWYQYQDGWSANTNTDTGLDFHTNTDTDTEKEIHTNTRKLLEDSYNFYMTNTVTNSWILNLTDNDTKIYYKY